MSARFTRRSPPVGRGRPARSRVRLTRMTAIAAHGTDPHGTAHRANPWRPRRPRAGPGVRPRSGAHRDRALRGRWLPPRPPGAVPRPVDGPGTGDGLGHLRRRPAARGPRDAPGARAPGPPVHGGGQARRRNTGAAGRGLDRAVPLRPGRPRGRGGEACRGHDQDRVADDHRRRLQHRRRHRAVRRGEPGGPADLDPALPGVRLRAASSRRWCAAAERGLPPFTVMSCDNVPANGESRGTVSRPSPRLRDPELGEWVDREVRFPNSMVDRITPVTTDEDRADLARHYGVDDQWPVVVRAVHAVGAGGLLHRGPAAVAGRGGPARRRRGRRTS